MGRIAGTLVRCTCVKCGAVELEHGCNDSYRCHACRPVRPQQDPQYLAHHLVSRAVLRGEIPRARNLKCVDCGARAAGYDHRDYSKPLEIAPVCRRCNARRGPAIGHVVRRPGRKARATRVQFPAPAVVDTDGTSSHPGACLEPPV